MKPLLSICVIVFMSAFLFFSLSYAFDIVRADIVTLVLSTVCFVGMMVWLILECRRNRKVARSRRNTPSKESNKI